MIAADINDEEDHCMYSISDISKRDILHNKLLSRSILGPYYRGFIRKMELNTARRVLEFGAGSGGVSRHLAAALADSGGTLDCVNLSYPGMSSFQDSLGGYHNKSFSQGDTQDLELPDCAYDAVVVHYQLHSIPEPERVEVVQKLAAALKPGGRMMVREPQRGGFSVGKLTLLARGFGLTLQYANYAEKPLLGEYFDAHFHRTDRETIIQDH